MTLAEKVKEVINNEFMYDISNRFNLPGVKKVEIVLVDSFTIDGFTNYRVIGRDTYKKINEEFKKDLKETIKEIDDCLDKHNSLSLDTQTLVLTFENDKVLTVYSSEWLTVGLS